MEYLSPFWHDGYLFLCDASPQIWFNVVLPWLWRYISRYQGSPFAIMCIRDIWEWRAVMFSLVSLRNVEKRIQAISKGASRPVISYWFILRVSMINPVSYRVSRGFSRLLNVYPKWRWIIKPVVSGFHQGISCSNHAIRGRIGLWGSQGYLMWRRFYSKAALWGSLKWRLRYWKDWHIRV